MEKSYILNIFNNKQFIIMKKYLIIFVLALCAAVQSNAQATWNVRAGGGLVGIINWYYDDVKFGPMFSIESNIPFSRISKWCISPSAIWSCDTFDGSSYVIFPIHFGYKIPVGSSSLLIPKVGPFVGYGGHTEASLFGPSVELAYEHNHFIAALNASLNVIDANPYVFLSFGYKF